MNNMVKRLVHYLLMAALLLVVPLLCALASGNTSMLKSVCQFPPRTEDFQLHPAWLWNVRRPFSWFVFLAMVTFTCWFVGPFVRRSVRAALVAWRTRDRRVRRPSGCWPWWGWAGLVLLAVSWWLSWNRFAWFRPYQVMCSYFPIWVGFIIALNAWCVKRSGHSPLTDHPVAYLCTFPASSLFWWFFEYLNRYVWNWYYLGISQLSGVEYVVYATLCFSSVLPAVMAIAALLRTTPAFADDVHQGMMKVNIGRPGWIAFLIGWAAIGLVGIVFCPDGTYPFIWMSPLCAFLLIQKLLHEESVADRFVRGDYSVFFRYMVASLLCGFCWETWNFHAYAKWVYAVPWVHRWQIWEMPLIGFAGYLPFGVECAAVTAWLYSAFGISDDEL